ncbi:unnamed protein product [Tilletia controversa]|uniref:Uncharacterized protein n=1 Tax=Tilletia caries TaxID=13290 RepID=A0ABN7J426_9BASI|nr:unnamed protein product [Tilletia caries]CAD6959464.1 unnamed protein product [Tilletia controversa]CAD7061505.1 unnamed protein product [Tilletia caries]
MRAVVSAEDRRLAKLNLSTNPLMKPSTSPLMIAPSDNATPGTSNIPAPASSTTEQTQSNPPALEGAHTMESQTEDYDYDEAQANKAIVTPATEPSLNPKHRRERHLPHLPPTQSRLRQHQR